jgi:hypothetical protein
MATKALSVVATASSTFRFTLIRTAFMILVLAQLTLGLLILAGLRWRKLL